VLLQHRHLVLRVEAASVDDEHAAMALACAADDEPLECLAGLRSRLPVQIEVGLPCEVPAPQPADEPRIEPDDVALDIFARLADVKSRVAAHEVAQLRERFGVFRGRRTRLDRGWGDAVARLLRELRNARHRVAEKLLVVDRRRRRGRGRWRGWYGFRGGLDGCETASEPAKRGVQRPGAAFALRGVNAGACSTPRHVRGVSPRAGATLTGRGATVRIERSAALVRELLERAPRELRREHVAVLPPRYGGERHAQ